MSTSLKPGLYIVATPIGNLGDITERARSTLSSVQFILCEDTRQTKKLLTHYSLLKNQRLICANEHTEYSLKDFMVNEIKKGAALAFVSDAGTPGICDPGHQLVAFAHQHNLSVVPIPGASSLTAFLSCIPYCAQPIHFVGFLPRKEKGIIERLQQNHPEDYLLVFLESPQRIVRTVHTIKKTLPEETQCYIGRELTKIYEQIWCGTLLSLSAEIGALIPDKGEFIMAIEIKKTLAENWHNPARTLSTLLGVKKTSQWISEHFDVRKNQVYDFLTQL